MAQPVVDNFHGLAAFARTQAVRPLSACHASAPASICTLSHPASMRADTTCTCVCCACLRSAAESSAHGHCGNVHSWLAVDRPGAGPWPASTARPHIVPAAMLQLLPWRMYAPAGASDHSLARRARASTLCASALCKPRRGTWRTSYM